MPFKLEALRHQLSHLRDGAARDVWTGETGAKFVNHDQLWLSSDAPGLEAGFALEVERDESRTLVVRASRTPDSGTLEIRLNGAVILAQRDMFAPAVSARSLQS